MGHLLSPSESTVSMKFICAVGNFTPGGEAYPYEFDERAPRSLCTLPIDRKFDPDPDATGVFLTSLVDRYTPEILASRTWRCEICGEPGKELFHSAISMLSPGPAVQLGFEPTVWDTVVPICRSGGACDVAAYEMAHKFAKISLPNQIDEEKCCDYCGKLSGVMVCGGCKVLGYCSKECQSKSWPLHKKNCIHAQKQRARESAENIVHNSANTSA